MFKAATVTSDDAYSRRLGWHLASALQKKLDRRPNVCWLFCAPKQGLPELLEGINDASGTNNIVGCTSDGEMSGDGYATGSAILGGIVSDQIDFTISYAENLSQNCEAAGKHLAAKMPPAVRYMQLFSDGITGNGCSILRGIWSTLGQDLPIAGGTAGDEGKFYRTWQFAGNKLMTDAAVAVGFMGEFFLGTGVRSGWSPIGLAKKVTRASENILYELNGEPALQVYERFLGKHADKLPAVGVEYPLGLVGKCMDDDSGDYYLLRATMSVDRKEGSIRFAGEIPEGATVHLTCGDSSSILQATSEAARLADEEIGDIHPQMIFFYSCMARKIVLGQRTHEEVDRVRRVFGTNVPIIGFYTYGEYCRVSCSSPSLFHNETATVSVIGT
ncbi:hypothetical protein JY97_11400 [Alkalispirochaeta odontotermitis]|nr:hypothetical protein JY97_11400 [Alkalispirochaeta odontotermitis]CAB1076604.1 hypothetical protein D1AOALGA4SA_4400 [Olavius algarvensis Delta 1 endosymbiont]